MWSVGQMAVTYRSVEQKLQQKLQIAVHPRPHTPLQPPKRTLATAAADCMCLGRAALGVPCACPTCRRSCAAGAAWRGAAGCLPAACTCGCCRSHGMPAACLDWPAAGWVKAVAGLPPAAAWPRRESPRELPPAGAAAEATNALKAAALPMPAKLGTAAGLDGPGALEAATAATDGGGLVVGAAASLAAAPSEQASAGPAAPTIGAAVLGGAAAAAGARAAGACALSCCTSACALGCSTGACKDVYSHTGSSQQFNTQVLGAAVCMLWS